MSFWLGAFETDGVGASLVTRPTGAAKPRGRRRPENDAGTSESGSRAAPTRSTCEASPPEEQAAASPATVSSGTTHDRRRFDIGSLLWFPCARRALSAESCCG